MQCSQMINFTAYLNTETHSPKIQKKKKNINTQYVSHFFTLEYQIMDQTKQNFDDTVEALQKEKKTSSHSRKCAVVYQKPPGKVFNRKRCRSIVRMINNFITSLSAQN